MSIYFQSLLFSVDEVLKILWTANIYANENKSGNVLCFFMDKTKCL